MENKRFKIIALIKSILMTAVIVLTFYLMILAFCEAIGVMNAQRELRIEAYNQGRFIE